MKSIRPSRRKKRIIISILGRYVSLVTFLAMLIISVPGCDGSKSIGDMN